jgi:RNA polymerase sigma-54 factor
VLRFLIESLNDDGYLEDSLQELAEAWPATTWSSSRSWCTASPWRCGCCKAWSPWAWARATGRMPAAAAGHLLQRGEAEASVVQTALAICAQPLDLLARRDLRR